MMAKTFPKRVESFIGGRFIPQKQNDRIFVLSPITGNEIYTIPRSGESEICTAQKFADSAFMKWKNTAASTRSAVLNLIAQVIEENCEVLAQIEVIDTGRLLTDARKEIASAAQYFKYFASCIVVQEGAAAQVNDVLSINLHEPLGVIGVILPWNFPLLMFSWKVAPIIAAGNVVIIKPSELACIAVIKLMELIGDKIPKGLINVILGDGDQTGFNLLKYGRFQKISFTGNANTGRKISSCLAQKLTPVSLEMGGKSACIVTQDVFKHDRNFVESCIKNILKFTYNQGQVCGNLSRLIVHSTVFDKLMSQITIYLNDFSVGDPRLKVSNMGPLISNINIDRISKLLSVAKSEGADLEYFDKTVKLTEECKNGFYFPPVLVKGDHSMNIYQEEIFGPILCCDKYESLEEAVALANNTVYGLTSSVWTRDITEINFLIKNLVSGKVWVNTAHVYYPHTKFGGVKGSGLSNEMHKSALNEYQYVKNIVQKY